GGGQAARQERSQALAGDGRQYLIADSRVLHLDRLHHGVGAGAAGGKSERAGATAQRRPRPAPSRTLVELGRMGRRLGRRRGREWWWRRFLGRWGRFRRRWLVRQLVK